jgi:hypothetical protein
MADCYENGCAKGTLDRGGSTPPLSSSSVLFQGGVELPQSKALRAFSCAVASRRLMGICGEFFLHGARRILEWAVLRVGGGWPPFVPSEKTAFRSDHPIIGKNRGISTKKSLDKRPARLKLEVGKL